MYTIYGFDSFSKEEYLDFFKKLLLSNYRIEIENVLAQPDPSLYYTLVVEFSQILEGDVNFGPLFIAEPSKLLPIFNEALLLAQEKIILLNKGIDNDDSIDSGVGGGNNNNNEIQRNRNNIKNQYSSQLSTTSSVQFNNSNLKIKRNCKIRVCDLPKCKEISQSSLPRSNQVGLFVEFRGTVIRSGHTRVLEKTKQYECNKCHYAFEVTIDFEQFNQYKIPKKCPNPEINCASSWFKPTDQVGQHCDYQEIKLQEQIHQLGAGSIPGSIVVLLQEDLVDQCQAGDDIIVSGIVIRRWRSIRNDDRCDIEIVLLANYIKVMNEQKFAAGMTDEIRRQFEEFWIQHEDTPLIGRNRILRQVCSGVYGLFTVKLALTLILIGGCGVDEADIGAKKRGECHLLLVGEPGTGKSQFLKFAAKISQRSVLTTGIGTTSAGLTAASVKEPGSGEMVLEAGALVLADGGVCCIDEFSGIRTKDRATIHEAMEQQSLSIAKGGVISRLHTRTSIIAATNAKGKYDQNETLTVNTSLASPLLSRFDVILLLTDDQNKEWDEKVSDFILRQAMIGSGQQQQQQQQQQANGLSDYQHDDFWNLEMFQSYIYYVKGCFMPQLTEASKQLIDKYYSRQRSNVQKANESRTTVRLLESLIRLSQAHARLMFRNTVEVQDAIIAIFLLESSIESNCIFANLNAQHSMFPLDPDADYLNLEKKVKYSLGLSNLVSNNTKRIYKKKPLNHKILNSNWVNDDHDNDNEEDEEEEYGNEEEQEEGYEQQIDENGYEEEFEEAQHQQQLQQQKQQQNEEEQFYQDEEFVQQQQEEEDHIFKEMEDYNQQEEEEEKQEGEGSPLPSWAQETQYSQQEDDIIVVNKSNNTTLKQPIQSQKNSQTSQQQQKTSTPATLQQKTPTPSYQQQHQKESQNRTSPPKQQQQQQQQQQQKNIPSTTSTPSTLPQKTPVPSYQQQQERESQLFSQSSDSFSQLEQLSSKSFLASSTTSKTITTNNISQSNKVNNSQTKSLSLESQENYDELDFSFTTPSKPSNNNSNNNNNNNSNKSTSTPTNNKSTTNVSSNNNNDYDDLSFLEEDYDEDISVSQKSKLNNSSVCEDKMVTEISKLNTQDNNDAILKEMVDDEDGWENSDDEGFVVRNNFSDKSKQQQSQQQQQSQKSQINNNTSSAVIPEEINDIEDDLEW